MLKTLKGLSGLSVRVSGNITLQTFMVIFFSFHFKKILNIRNKVLKEILSKHSHI